MPDVYGDMSATDLLTLSPHVLTAFGPYVGGDEAVRLNLGCGCEPEPGFINVDRVAGHGADLVRDLEVANLSSMHVDTDSYGPSQFVYQDSVDFVLASHVLEHITNLIPLMREIHRVLKPGGYLGIAAPYASADAAWEDPTHVRAFTELSWSYFDQRLYEQPGHAGHYPSPIDFSFDVVSVTLIPFPEFVHDPELEFKKRHWRNVIREVQAVLQKVER